MMNFKIRPAFAGFRMNMIAVANRDHPAIPVKYLRIKCNLFYFQSTSWH